MNEKIAAQIEEQKVKETTEGQSLSKFMASYKIPEEKVDEIAVHFHKLLKKFPHMKYDRLFKKTANYFHLKNT